MYYLTPQDYEIAEQNGISRALAYKRFYDYNWTTERTITKPVRTPKHKWAEWKELAEANGIKRNTFFQRVSKGIPPHDAATVKSFVIPSKIPQWVWEKAEENGIAKAVVKNRINNGKWEYEKACTEPVGTRGGYRGKK